MKFAPRSLRFALMLLLVTAPSCAQSVDAKSGDAKAGDTKSGDKEPLQKDDLFAGTDRFAQGAKEVTEVNLDKKMLAMMGQFDGKKDTDKSQLDLAKKMDFVYVRSYEYAKAGGYRTADLEAFRVRLETGAWTHVVKERSEAEQTDVWVRSDNEDQFSELVVISAERTELTFVHLKGRMSMKDLAKAGGKYGAPQPTDEKLQRRSK